MLLKEQKTILFTDVCCLALLLVFLLSLPSKLFRSPSSYVLEASNGELLSAAIARDGQWRFPVADSVPEKFAQCIVAFEDKRFYQHPGIDILAMGRAMRQNFKARTVVSGGSTLTMQVIRLSRRESRTIGQKLIEMVLALRLELGHSKNDILKLYAANAPFGSNVVGLEAASWRYFGRGPEALSWGEMATLAVLPNSPALVHPGKNSARLIKKRNDLLDKLAVLGTIDQATANLSKLEPIPGKPQALPQYAPHLLNRFKSEQASLKNKGTRISSTLDYDLQLKLNALLKRYNNRYRANDINNIAALVLDVKKGTVLSYVGNIYQPENKELESHVDMIRAARSPGSTLKPLLYASMLNDGFILPRTLIPDVPTQIGGYSPQNYDLGYDGAIPADRALSRSLNIPAVKMLQTYKYQRFYDKLKKLGFSTLNRPADHYGLSLILGGSEVTMWDLARTYMGMARTLNHFNDYKGRYNPHDYDEPLYINARRDTRYDGDETQVNSVFDHGSVWNAFNAMEELMRPGEEGLWEQFSSSQRLAWKTGTSFGFRDAWAVGLNPDYVVCVWVGNADGEGRPGLTGIDAAAPVLFDIFKQLPAGKWFRTPKNKLKKMRVCRQSGYKAGEYCGDVLEELVSPAGEKTVLCPYHKLVHLDRTGTYRVTDACEAPAEMQHRAWFILPPAMEYYYKIKNSDYKVLPPFKPGCGDVGSNYVMEMIYPKNNASIYVPLELDGSRGKVVLNATHRDADIKIYWHIDGAYVATTKNYHQLAVSPAPGKHTLTLVDENGERLVQTFTILDKEKN
ncbi:penicillin-binding protein 1C [Pedobacter heparinus]|uniref:peptidoglycan glycosyltransferase n=1 Tax=Pedobacter heparinus (strain ATCC 13125 / DSM 2366 / CIP 104194 / JCM 7457 / NBRC 12017 / NCIMB 9290 / NRRL B-14731 / HIM 762-3) TaxID=485917 RepID=C6XXX8_PEDHD|nr:penicillin-binding protein 1C [Pedobacter heparinus]ACU04396.1 penicillin-binding protein 1C [Pedobacter heparinus DSM 2366]